MISFEIKNINIVFNFQDSGAHRIFLANEEDSDHIYNERGKLEIQFIIKKSTKLHWNIGTAATKLALVPFRQSNHECQTGDIGWDTNFIRVVPNLSHGFKNGPNKTKQRGF